MIEGQSKLAGIFPATYTPFHENGDLYLEQIPPMVEYLTQQGVNGLYICGSTGEGMSLSSEEREAVAKTFVDAAEKRITTVVQVGHNSLAEARRLASHAQSIGADAISATAPSYYHLQDVLLLVECMAEIANAAPSLPFYYYDIPSLTGVEVDMVEFLKIGGETIPNLAGLKYTSPTIPGFQACLELEHGRYELFWGNDEMLLSALAVGGKAAVGSTYNIAAPLYKRMMQSFENRDLDEARRCQSLSMNLVRRLSTYPFHPAMKEVMKMNGIDCGPCRRPLGRMTTLQVQELRKDLEAIGYFEWSKPRGQ